MWRKNIGMVLFCLACFVGGVFLYPLMRQFDPGDIVLFGQKIFSGDSKNSSIQKPDSSGEKNIPNKPTTQVDTLLSTPVRVQELVQNEIKPGIDTDNPESLSNTYLIAQKKILDTYSAGARDTFTVQSALYIASLENRIEDAKKIEQDWCKNHPQECQKSYAEISIEGTIVDEKNTPIPNVQIQIAGEKKPVVYTDVQGKYTLRFTTWNPRRIRILATHPEFAGGSFTVSTIDPRLQKDPKQPYHANFSLVRAMQTATIDLAKKLILTGEGRVTGDGYVFENSFSRYLIPFGTIKRPNGQDYTGIVVVKIFEFNRTIANAFLQADVMTDVYGFASEGLVTYGMPMITFYDPQGGRLEIFKNQPLTIWTTNRELHSLVLENSQGVHQPGWNPNEYEAESSPERVAQYIKEDEQKAYTISQKNPGKYPITLDWIYQNYSRLPGFFVYDQTTGIWENTGYSLAEPSTDTAYSMMAPFWTKI